MNPKQPTVLVVDDQAVILKSITLVLRYGGYSPIAASGPLQALKESRDFNGEIDLLLTDIVMPEMDGFALAREIAAERKTIRILLMTGYAKEPSGLPIVKKPFRMHELLDRVQAAIDGPPPFAPSAG